VQQANAKTKSGRHHRIGVLFPTVVSFWWDNVVLAHACAQNKRRISKPYLFSSSMRLRVEDTHLAVFDAFGM
jgi:hypothetical protein